MNFYKIRALLEGHPRELSTSFRNVFGAGGHMRRAKNISNATSKIQRSYRNRLRGTTARKRLLGGRVFSALLAETYRPGGKSYQRVASAFAKRAERMEKRKKKSPSPVSIKHLFN